MTALYSLSVISIARHAVNTAYPGDTQKGLARTLMAYSRYNFAWHVKVVVPGRQFATSWLAIYKYNHLYYVEIFDSQNGGCRKTDTNNESTLRVRKFQTWSHGRLSFTLNF